LSIVAIAIFGLAAYLLPSTKVSAGIANHVVISEIQVSGDVANDEFIELYNPTSQAVDITGWLLYRKNSSGTIGNMVTSMSGTIPAYGYYLIAHDGYNGTTPRDTGYSNSSNTLSDDNGVFLKDGADNLIDMVGMGSSTDAELFGTLIPIAGESVERKALPNSTNTTMDTNGIHALLGNGEDTNNNGSDFTSRNIPQPQNSASPIENPNIAQPTPTITPTAAPTVAPSPTIAQPSPTGVVPSATPVPQVSPTTAPSPTVAPSPTEIPSVSPSPTVTNAPTAAPTVAPSPTTAQPSPTGVVPSATPVPQVSPTTAPSPTVAPSPTPTPGDEVVMMDNQFMTCKKTYRSISIMFLTFRMPSFSCLSK
jgi:hypothetical protein